MRTPLSTMRNQSRMLARCMPELLAAYQQAAGERDLGLSERQLHYLSTLGEQIDAEIRRANFIVEMMLASSRARSLAREDFANHSVKKCVDGALACYPFEQSMRDRFTVQEVITSFGGKILCESQPGQYTRFSLLFPG